MIHTIYQAGPLFSQAERQWHQQLTLKLEKAGHIVLWPGDLISPELIAEAGEHAPRFIFDNCLAGIDESTIMVALLDGSQVDAYAKGMPIYGIRTDSRIAGDTHHNRMNSMIEGCLTGLAESMEELVTMINEAPVRPT